MSMFSEFLFSQKACNLGTIISLRLTTGQQQYQENVLN